MAKTLKQILDGIKSSKTKTKDILGTKPGVDYSPKAGDERKFADKHHVDQHADRVGNGSDVYQATNVKYYMDTDKAANHGYKSGEDEKVYEEAAKCNMSEAGKMCEVHGMKQCPAKVLKEKPVKEDVEQVSELMVQNYISGSKGKSAEVHKNMNAGNYTVKKMAGGKEVGSSDHEDSASAHAAAKKHLGEELTEDKVTVHYTGSPYHGKKVEVTKRNPDGSVHVRMQHSEGPEGRMRTGILKPGQYIDNVKEEVEEIDEGYSVKKTKVEKSKDPEYGSDADIHHYDVIHNKSGNKIGVVKKGLFGAKLHIGDKSGYDIGSGDVQAAVNKSLKNPSVRKRLNVEEVELEEKAAVAKSKQTVLVTKKGTKSAGGVMRIKKSEYDPKKHDLAEDEEINELSKDTIGRYAGKAHNRGDMAARMSNAGKNKDMAAYANKRHSGVQNAINKLSGRARVNATEDTEIEERKMTPGEMEKREKYVKGMKKKLSDFRSRYGERAKDVMYATATKQAMKEDLAQPLIGSTDPTKDKKKKKENEQSAPAVTPITMPNFSADVNTGRNV